MLFESRGQIARDLGRRSLRIEDRVSTLDVSLDVLVAKPRKQFAKLSHRQLSGSTHVDGSQQRDKRRHG
jgi:hypothetical protein